MKSTFWISLLLVSWLAVPVVYSQTPAACFHRSIDGQSKSGETVAHTFTYPGPKLVTLTISNGSQQFTTSDTVNITNGCDLITTSNLFLSHHGNTSGCSTSSVCLTDEDITFTVTAVGYNFNCGPHFFYWEFGDGSRSASEPIAVHRFPDSPGFRLVSVMILAPQQIVRLTTPVSLATCLPLEVQPAALPAGRVGGAYAVNLAAVGAISPPMFEVRSGSLPPGLTLTMEGVLSGVPKVGGTHRFIVSASTATSCPMEVPYELVVLESGRRRAAGH
jgi:hypothetical protein